MRDDLLRFVLTRRYASLVGLSALAALLIGLAHGPLPALATVLAAALAFLLGTGYQATVPWGALGAELDARRDGLDGHVIRAETARRDLARYYHVLHEELLSGGLSEAERELLAGVLAYRSFEPGDLGELPVTVAWRLAGRADVDAPELIALVERLTPAQRMAVVDLATRRRSAWQFGPSAPEATPTAVGLSGPVAIGRWRGASPGRGRLRRATSRRA